LLLGGVIALAAMVGLMMVVGGRKTVE